MARSIRCWCIWATAAMPPAARSRWRDSTSTCTAASLSSTLRHVSAGDRLDHGHDPVRAGERATPRGAGAGDQRAGFERLVAERGRCADAGGGRRGGDGVLVGAADVGSTAVVGYDLRYRSGGGAWANSWERSTATARTITGLTNGLTYAFQVRAVNESLADNRGRGLVWPLVRVGQRHAGRAVAEAGGEERDLAAHGAATAGQRRRAWGILDGAGGERRGDRGLRPGLPGRRRRLARARPTNARGSSGWSASASATPTAALTGDGDHDRDDDGLIEIATAAQLDAIRHDLGGDGAVDAGGDAAAYEAAFAAAGPGMGCRSSGCELGADLDLSGWGDAGGLDAYRRSAGVVPGGPRRQRAGDRQPADRPRRPGPDGAVRLSRAGRGGAQPGAGGRGRARSGQGGGAGWGERRRRHPALLRDGGRVRHQPDGRPARGTGLDAGVLRHGDSVRPARGGWSGGRGRRRVDGQLLGYGGIGPFGERRGRGAGRPRSCRRPWTTRASTPPGTWIWTKTARWTTRGTSGRTTSILRWRRTSTATGGPGRLIGGVRRAGPLTVGGRRTAGGTVRGSCCLPSRPATGWLRSRRPTKHCRRVRRASCAVRLCWPCSETGPKLPPVTTPLEDCSSLAERG